MRKRFQGLGMMGAAALLAPGLLLAQNAEAPSGVGASTPPELRNFRLDAPPPRPAQESRPSQTQPQPRPVSEAAQSTPVRDAPSRDTEIRQPARQPERSAEPRSEVPPSPPAQNTPAVDTLRDRAPNSPAIPAMSPESVASDREPEAKPEAAKILWRDQLLWIGPALALLAALAAAYFLHRRRLARLTGGVAAPIQQPSPPTRLDRRDPENAAPQPQGVAPMAAARPVSAPVFAEFKPESAQLSIASLSVTGTLAVHNRSNTPITDLFMRSHMISVQAGQQEAITRFHDAKGAGSVQSLGMLDAGERIDAVIEIRLPRSELAAFRWTEREFVAPIILINLSGHAGETGWEVRLSQLIGRAGSGATARMKPLAVDRGPKRFTGISARPLFA